VRSERDIAAERIVVTGATGGIGKEIARALISRGALLTLIARDADKAAATERPHWELFDDYNARNATAAFSEIEWE